MSLDGRRNVPNVSLGPDGIFVDIPDNTASTEENFRRVNALMNEAGITDPAKQNAARDLVRQTNALLEVGITLEIPKKD